MTKLKESSTAIEDVFDLGQFHSIETKFKKLKNVTTNTEVSDPSSVKMCEFNEKSFAFEVAKPCGAKGHNLFITVQVTVPEKSGSKVISFECTTVIKRIDILDDAVNKVTVDLIQYEEKIWKNFISVFHERQEEILNFLKAVKG